MQSPASSIAVLCTLLPVAGVAQSAPAPTAESVELAGGATLAAESWRIEVPENRADPGAKGITLAVLRVRAPGAEPGVPVFLLAGGPGGSSIDLLRTMLRGGGRPFLELMGGDVVAIDQRGVGRSEPCLESDVRYELPVGEPGDPAALLARMREVGRREAARWKAAGVDLRGYTTAESADDIDAVRRALGCERIALFGISYGTHLALATIRRHEAVVARAVLVGPEGPDDTFKLPSQVQRGLERVAALAARDPAVAARLPDLVGAVRTVLDRLADGPVFVDVDGARVGVSRFDVQRFLANEIGHVRRHAERVPALVAGMLDGDFTTIARELREQRAEDGVGSAMQIVMDGASGLSPARAERIAREAPDCVLGDVVNFPFPDLAEAWGAPDLGPAFRAPLRTDVPVLILVGDVDSRTPVANADALLEHLPNGRCVVVENAGHDLNWLQPELRQAWSRFLAGEPVASARVTAPPPRFVPIAERAAGR